MSSGSFAVAIHILAVLSYLKKEGEEVVSSDLISKSVNSHPVAIRNVLCSLKRAGLVKCKEGKGGGVTLARASSKITLKEIFFAVGEKSVFKVSKKAEFKQCPVSVGIKRVLPRVFEEIDQVVADSLDRRTLADIEALI